MKVIKDSEFANEIKNSDIPVLVDFYAEWCSPCRQLGPVLEEVSKEIGDAKLKVVKMNIDESPETPTNFGVRGIPTLIMFKNGEAVATHSGAITKSKLSAWINEQM
ncbi:MAG: thioredoxin [Alphaproteobacteria bacterium]|nr:thioredoxin [Alphaproteobacteria bacterium]